MKTVFARGKTANVDAVRGHIVVLIQSGQRKVILAYSADGTLVRRRREPY